MASASPAPDIDQPAVGSYFVANYPPFSVWTAGAAASDATRALAAPPADVPLGLYLHIPFCRKRCHFCYFRVYVDKNAREVEQYLETLAREWEQYVARPAIAGRPLNFVYFGGGTPSFLSTRQLRSLVGRLGGSTPWSTAEEITFECEPGTLTESKMTAIRRMGVTRLSLGVENFDDRILELNGRAHRSPEIGRSYEYARRLGFPQINFDLIAGMLGETDANWRACVQRTIDLAPDSVTIYQMELPYNTTITGDLLKGTGRFSEPVADWATKRRWVAEAFEALEGAGYHIGSAYTAVRNPSTTKFLYRDRLWEGADLVGLGVASFGHVNGVHVQNVDTWEAYVEKLQKGELPFSRAFPTTERDRLIREVVLLLKTGHLDVAYFRDKYKVDIRDEFRAALEKLSQDGWLTVTGDSIDCTPDGLIQIDRHLPAFFDPQYISSRYT